MRDSSRKSLLQGPGHHAEIRVLKPKWWIPGREARLRKGRNVGPGKERKGRGSRRPAGGRLSGSRRRVGRGPGSPRRRHVGWHAATSSVGFQEPLPWRPEARRRPAPSITHSHSPAGVSVTSALVTLRNCDKTNQHGQSTGWKPREPGSRRCQGAHAPQRRGTKGTLGTKAEEGDRTPGLPEGSLPGPSKVN